MELRAINRAAAKYDPGIQVDTGECLCLHRNENLFVDRHWDMERLRPLLGQVSISTYPDPMCNRLREAIAEFHGVGAENVFVGNGSDEVLADLLALFRESYESMHLLDTCFRVYYMLARRCRYQVVTLSGDTFSTGRIASNGWRGLAVVDSPNAITGVSTSEEDLRGLATREESFVIWDNVYGEYVSDEIPVPLNDNVALVKSFSKFYALAGVRVGYCIADRGLIAELLERKDIFNVNAYAQVLAVEALRRRGEFQSLAYEVVRCRDELVARLEEFGFTVHLPTANFVLAAHREHRAETIRRALLERGVAVRRFPDPLTANHIRITVPPMSGVELFTGAMTSVLRGL